MHIHQQVSGYRLRYLGLLLFGLISQASWAANNGSPFYPPGDFGPFQVGHIQENISDPLRGDSNLPVDIWYPAQTGSEQDLPVVEYPVEPWLSILGHIARTNLPSHPKRTTIGNLEGLSKITYQPVYRNPTTGFP